MFSILTDLQQSLLTKNIYVELLSILIRHDIKKLIDF